MGDCVLCLSIILTASAVILSHEETRVRRWPVAESLVFLTGLFGLALTLAMQFGLLGDTSRWTEFGLCALLTTIGIPGAFFWHVGQLRPDLAQSPLNQHRFVRSAENRWALFGLIYWLVVFGVGSAARWSNLPYATEIIAAFGILGYILIPWLGIPRTIAKWEKK